MRPRATIRVDVDIELDTEPREVSVPPDFAEALDRDADARRFFDGLSYSNKRRFVMGIEDAKRVREKGRGRTVEIEKPLPREQPSAA